MPSIAAKEKIAESRISFQTMFNGALDQIQTDPIEQLAMEVQSSSEGEDYNWLGTVPSFTEWLDDRKLSSLRAEGFRLMNRDWANGLRIHRNEVLDDKLGQVRPRIEMLAQKALQHRPKLLVETLANGFDGARSDVGDGLAYDGAFYFSDSHQDGEGPQQSNRTDLPLSPAAYETMWQAMTELVDEEGDPLDIAPTHLLIGPNYRSVARRMLNAELIAEDGVAVSNINAGTIQLLISPRLRGPWANHWFLLDLSQPVKPLILQNREAITFDAVDDLGSDSVFMRKELKFGAQARYAAGYGLWQFAYGSTGAAA